MFLVQKYSHDIAEILLKVALNTLTLNPYPVKKYIQLITRSIFQNGVN